jgi:predicted GH43/DUF377 family glycosyl hydrolase
MKWKKLGKIFDPTEHTLVNNCVEFAQSPQTLVFDDFVRIFFSTREKDKTGKYLSHVAFVDFDKEFKNVIKVSEKTVIPLGELGCFDEHGIFPINVLKHSDKIYAYTTGWNRKVSVVGDSSIGLAFSDDNGSTFQKYGNGPVLSASLHEPFLVADAFVSVFKNKFYMWYIYGTQWTEFVKDQAPERVYKIALATSDDGINWVRDGAKIVSDKINKEECQALPTVIEHNKLYHMYFCYRHASGFRTDKEKGYRLGYAFSGDLINWVRDDEKAGITVSEIGWDSDMICYPHIFKVDDKIYLLYNGNEFGKFGFGIAVLED